MSHKLRTTYRLGTKILRSFGPIDRGEINVRNNFII